MTPQKKILIPTDGSAYTKEAIAQGLQLARLMNAEITAMYVVDLSSFTTFFGAYESSSTYRKLKEEGEEAVEYVRQEGERMGVKVLTTLEEGIPATKIIEASKDYDMIVMGTLGRTGMPRALLGSVAEKVVEFAACPVLVVRIPLETET